MPPPFDSAWFLFVLGCLIGAVLGSFGTVLAYRIPRGESIVIPRSHCPLCGTFLTARELVPIFSWLLYKGRCRTCAAPISCRYPLIEGITALACGFATLRLGLSAALPFAYVGILALVAAATLSLPRKA